MNTTVGGKEQHCLRYVKERGNTEATTRHSAGRAGQKVEWSRLRREDGWSSPFLGSRMPSSLGRSWVSRGEDAPRYVSCSTTAMSVRRRRYFAEMQRDPDVRVACGGEAEDAVDAFQVDEEEYQCICDGDGR